MNNERGFALVTVMMLAGLISALLAAHFLLTRTEQTTTRSTMDGGRGFYAAEAGVNLRAEGVRKVFLGYNRPTGGSPTPIPGQLPCATGDLGSGDFACVNYDLHGREVRTYLDEDPTNPGSTVIPPDEDFQGLTAQEYAYEVSSYAVGTDTRPEAILGMRFTSRLIPLFQFAAFYDKDLEILPGPAMTFEGPVHTNGNLFLDAANSLTIDGQVTAVGELHRGRKESTACSTGTVVVHDLSGPLATPACSGSTRYELVEDDVNGTNPPNLDWQGLIHVGATFVDVPPPEALDPVPGGTYWDLADLRVMLHLTHTISPIKVHRADGAVAWADTLALATCGASAVSSTSGELFNARESEWMEVLEVDVQGLMDCIEGTPALMDGKTLDDTTEGGLVWYFGVDDGVNAAAPNNNGVRVRDGATLAPTSAAVDIAGLTVVTNQALYIEGDYNSAAGAGWRPAAFLADSLNVLSNAWNDDDSDEGLGSRVATSTTINAAFLAGTDTTGGPTGEGAFNTADYNGGLENYPRFHEDWSSATLTYRGSFVSLNRPIRVDGTWGAQSYSPPTRDWGYDTRFNDASNLPPLTPRFVYLKHDLFVREFTY